MIAARKKITIGGDGGKSIDSGILTLIHGLTFPKCKRIFGGI